MQIDQDFTERQVYAITRRHKKITLKEIAEVIKCSIPLLSMYENGRCNIDPNSENIYKKIIEKDED